MKIKLVKYDNEIISALAALVCTSNLSVEEVFTDENTKDSSKLDVLSRVLDMGHMSIIEHLTFTFIVSGISRALSHQLVRHRIASYSQKSQRYVKEEQFEYIVPPSIQKDETALTMFEEWMSRTQAIYDYLLVAKNIPAEDARFVLPNACETQIVITMNARSLLHFLGERCCTTAQWEIRKMANLMLDELKFVSPTIFKDAGPKCFNLGYCPEHKNRCCGFRKHKSDVLNCLL